MQIFHDAACRLENSGVADWKSAGGKVVGYTCSYTPPELFYAAGILPVRLRGVEAGGTEISDTYFGPFICSFPKCLLQLAGKGRYAFLDGLVITPGCDGMRRLDECWRKAGEDHGGIVPGYFRYFDVPHKSEAHGSDWYMEELQLLRKSLEDHFQVRVTDESLSRAIREFNRGRRFLGDLEDLRAREGSTVTGTDAFAAAVAGTVMPRESYTGALERWLSGLREEEPLRADARVRLMLAGSISDEIDLFRLIESTGEALVVAENLCFGVRRGGDAVEESGDPMKALAAHYLGSSICPRMFGRYKERYRLLMERLERCRVQGVILQNIRFCDLHGAENALLERDLEARGIPCLRLEREYGPHIDAGRIKLRISAFLERIAAAERGG
jgi:benzoyl-CoA reductase/2-hydroxyglutaryl-CoA dehydratase subunit BcrC/BadD/HgdB